MEIHLDDELKDLLDNTRAYEFTSTDQFEKFLG